MFRAKRLRGGEGDHGILRKTVSGICIVQVTSSITVLEPDF
jgi:hypothetical protein